MNILMAGDLVVNQSYDTNQMDRNIIELFGQSDLNIVNLEAPVTDGKSVIKKTGPFLKSNEIATLNVLKILNVNVVTLANNHVLDYDEQGVEDTLSFCLRNNISTVGAEMNLERASKALYMDTVEGKVAIINLAENEWASATAVTAGSNPLNLIDNAKQIKEAKRRAEFVFVIVHGGHEYYNYPSPRMQKQYRFYAEQGADIVVGHHTHCISGCEIYNGVPIYYSLGNFLFTKRSNYEDWYTGLVLEVKIINGNLVSALHPVKQHKEDFRLELILGKEREAVLNRISTLNDVIRDKSKLEQEWSSFVDSKYLTYLNNWSPLNFIGNRYLKAVLNKLGIKAVNKNGMRYTLNLMRCEAHADLSKEIIQRYLLK